MFDGNDPTESLADRAYRGIRERIREGRLQPGARVTELALAFDLGMSRTPVREAMRRLQAEGLIVSCPPRGLALARPNRDEIEEIVALRATLEAAAARFAAIAATAEQIALLDRLCAEHASVPADDISRVMDANRTFHRAVACAAGNRHLLRALDGFSDSLLLLGPSTLALPGRATEAWAEHRAIAAAIAARNPDAAEAAMRRHIEAAHVARVAAALWDKRPGD
jgi:DNA-binding GntR family transcriptional regulator